MSYDKLQKEIDIKISEYKQKVKPTYYTYYYYEALDLLDKYIFDLANESNVRNRKRISPLMREADNLQNDEYIYRNYILSLIIDDDRSSLGRILSSNNYSNDESMFDAEQAIYFFIDGFLNPKQFNNKEIIDRFEQVFDDLNYIDYRILYVLYKKYKIDVFKRGNTYLMNSYDNEIFSRKTLKSRLAMYCEIETKKQIDKYFNLILNDVDYLNQIKNKEFHILFIKKLGDKFNNKEEIKFLSGDVNYQSMKTYEYLLRLLDKDLYEEYKDFFDYIIFKYCSYMRFNSEDNEELIKKLFDLNKEESILAYYKIKSDKYLDYLQNKKQEKSEEDKKTKEDIELIIKKLKKNTQFTDLEYLFMNACKDIYLLGISKHLYKIELLDAREKKCKIVLEFEDYPERHVVDYRRNLYYYLPQSISKLFIIEDSKIKELKNFKITYLNDTKDNEDMSENIKLIIEDLTKYLCEESVVFNNGVLNNNLAYKFSTYILFKNVDEFIEVISKKGLSINKNIIDTLIYTKSIFKDSYSEILKKLLLYLNKNTTIRNKKELKKILSKELGSDIEEQKDIYETIEKLKYNLNQNEKIDIDKLDEVMDGILDLDRGGSSIQYPIFSSVVSIANKIGYYNNLNFVKLCEKFIYENKLVNEVIYEYMKNCYKRTYFLTDKTESVLKYINLYDDKDENSKDNLQMSLNYWIKSNKYDKVFISTFKNLCDILGEDEYPENEVVKNCIDFMFNLNNFDKYTHDLKMARIIENVYKKSKGYYKCLEVFLYIYINKGFVSELKNYTENIFSYYIENNLITDYSMFITAAIYKNKYYEDLEKDKIIKFKNYFIEALKYEIVDYNILEIGYKDEYKLDEKVIQRTFIKENEDIFLNEFSESRDREFKEKALCIYKKKNIYNKNIVEYLLSNRNIVNDDEEYKNLHILYINKEIEQDNSNCKIVFKHFLKECKILKEDSQYIEDTMIKLSQKDLQFELELFEYIDKNLKMVKLSSDYKKSILEKISQEKDIPTYIANNPTLLSVEEMRNIFIEYFRSLKFMDDTIYKNTVNIIKYAINQESQQIKNTIVNNIIDILLSNDFYQCFKDDLSIEQSVVSLRKSILIIIGLDNVSSYKKHEIYDKVLKHYSKIVKYINNIDILNKFIIKNFEGDLEGLKALYDMILKVNEKYKFTEKEQILINKKAKELFNIEVLNEDNLENSKSNKKVIQSYLMILNNLKSVKSRDRYYNIFKKAKQEFINGLIVLNRNYFENSLIKAYRGFDISCLDNELTVVKVENEKLYKIFKDYFNKDVLDELYFKDKDLGFKYNTLIFKSSQNLNEDMPIEKILELFIEYARLNYNLLNENFYIQNMRSNNRFLCNEKLITATIFKVEKVNNSKMKKDILKEKVKNIFNQLLDVVNKSNFDKKVIYIEQIKVNFMSSENKDLETLIYTLENIRTDIV